MARLPKKQISEQALIGFLRSRAGFGRNRGVVLGIGDDCALLRISEGEELAITTDLTLENVHFRRDWHPPESVGHRCLARGLSDLASMGARPVAAFLSLAVSEEVARSGWVERFIDGLLALADRDSVTLAGGDLAQMPASSKGGPAILADIVLTGSVKKGKSLRRSGAKAGDVIYVTGQLGGAAAELLALERNPAAFRRLKRAVPGHPHLFPEPRLRIGNLLSAKKTAHSAIDLSDGLSTDLRHICEESDLGAVVDERRIPVHPMALLAESAGWASSALDLALHGGEDYELLFTAPADLKMPARIDGVSIQAIGTMRESRRGRLGIEIVRRDGSKAELKPGGWSHFAASRPEPGGQ